MSVINLITLDCSRSNGLPPGPSIITSKYLRLSSCGRAEIPGAGSATRRSVSYKERDEKVGIKDLIDLLNLDNSLHNLISTCISELEGFYWLYLWKGHVRTAKDNKRPRIIALVEVKSMVKSRVSFDESASSIVADTQKNKYGPCSVLPVFKYQTTYCNFELESLNI
jgi:hypothetical protein